MPDLVRPAPVVLPDTAVFHEAVADQRLVIQKCSSCGRFQHPPGQLCRWCGLTDLGYEPVSGRARLWSWTVARMSFAAGFDSAVPYLILCVELVEQPGLLMLSDRPHVNHQIISQLHIGASMHAVFANSDGWTLVQFAFDDEV